VSAHVAFLLLGLGAGAIYAILGLGLVLQHRSTGVLNLGYGATGMFGTFAYTELRGNGYLLLPYAGPPNRIRVGPSTGLPPWPAFVIALVYAALLGFGLYWVVFRRLQGKPQLARFAASVGVLLYFSAIPSLYLGSYASRVTVERLLPADPVDVLGATIPVDRLYLTAMTVAIGVALWATYRFTRFGLATRAAAESEEGAAVLGYSSAALGAVNSVLASVIAAGAGILVAPITGLNPTRYTLFVIPALGAALLGKLSSFSVTLAAGLSLGMLGSWITKLQIDHRWLPDQGLVEGLPFIAIIVAITLFGTSLPTRGSLGLGRLPGIGRPRSVASPALAVAAIGTIALLTLSSGYRLGLIHSIVSVLLSLSLVVLTGYAGQMSLAQMAFGGLGGFFVSIFGDAAGVPFPLSLLLGASVATAIGVLVGLPALRTRGMHLAVLTLAAAVAIDSLVFGNASVAGGLGGRKVPAPHLFGLNLDIRSADPKGYPRPAFGIFVLAIGIGVAVLVANLRRGATGRRLLAVRSNERAASAAGIDVAKTKLLAFGLSSFIAGLAGGLIGLQNGVVSAQQFAVFTSLALLAFAYIGGIGRISGAVVSGLLVPSGLVYVAVDNAFSVARYITMIGGLALMIATTKREDGLAGALDRALSRVRSSVRARRLGVPPDTAGIGTVPEPASAPTARRIDRDARPLLEVTGLTVTFGGVHAVQDVCLEVYAGEVVGLIGPNGAGKTTAIDAITGFTSKRGRVCLDGADVSTASPTALARAGITRTFQTLELFDDLTVRENVQIALDDRSVRATAIDLVRPHRVEHSGDADPILDRFGLLPAADELPGELSHGIRAGVVLARAIAAQPRVLLLDEPGAGLGDFDRTVLRERIASLAADGLSVLVVDHDIALMLSVCDRLYVLDAGVVLAHGNPDTVRADPAVITAYLGDDLGAAGELVHQ
jgi:ABC-type branched-subunit amino acid transport system ATPase component/ABC-type branched-subunit amino acid transport system permease subunit